MAGKRLLKILSGVTLTWLMILVYMGMHLYQLVEESQKTLMALEETKVEAEILRKENMVLQRETNSRKVRAIHDDIEMAFKHKDNNNERSDEHKWIDTLVNKDIVGSFDTNRAPSIKYEISRRRIDNYVREMNYFLTDKFEKLKKKAGDVFMQYEFEKFKTDVEQLSLHTIHELEILRDLDGMGTYRKTMHRKLSNEVRQRLNKLQNPDDCKKARRLVCTLNKACGYGCQVHHIIYCMIMAYSSNRTMVINSRGWRYSKKGWEGTFLPVSESCRNVGFGRVYWGMAYNTKALIAHLPVIDTIYPKPDQLPQAVPRDLVDKIIEFHEVPFVWWVGQICAFLFRYQPSMKQRIDEKKRRIGFKSPIVGIHVRRTDKVNVEAAHHDLGEYVKWARRYFEKLELTRKLDARRIYMATDDRGLLTEAKEKYPDITFVSDNDASKLADLDHRHSEQSLYGIISDIELLSETDYVVCTFSSQVCRLAYEIMNGKHVDASRRFQSLDDVYYFGGQNEHKVRVKIAHKARDKSELDLTADEELAIAGNHWDGYSKAFSHSRGKKGTFPSYKVEEIVNLADFPIYD
ncbi:alpha-(1,6)-fucosyltransferase-like isoform X2 [Rhopilema esculentum]|uniref:alpha-(1,6)-fucosyltransferase-like isoform X2 n=1 Tax=Rhopilema esculentum TaxID=499914 RepID=UPI0031D8AF10